MILTWGDLGVIAGMMGTVATVIFSFLKSIRQESREFRATFDARLKLVEDKLETMDEKVDQKLADLQQNKVSHADWVRVATSQLNRQNRLSEQVAELSGKLDATVGLGAGMKRIADALVAKGQT